MSKSKDKNADPNANKPIPLPTLPKCESVDPNNRDKWSSEYDKTEGELLKSHLQNSVTIGLRSGLVPSGEWDRSIPAANAPVAGQPERGPPRAKTTEPDMDASRISNVGRTSKMSRPRSASQSPRNVSSSLSMNRNVSVQDCLTIVMTIIRPPLDFRTSFHVNLDGIDLRWLTSYKSGSRTPSMMTLDTLREDLRINPSAAHETVLNSPRSVIVMLRNGTNVQDVQAAPVDAFSGPGVTTEFAQMRHRHFESRRRDLLASLREEYRELCLNVPNIDLLEAIANANKTGKATFAGEEESSFIQARRRKQQQAIEMNKSRVHKALEYTEDMTKRVVAAEDKRMLNEAERRQKQQAQAEEARQRALQTQNKMVELKEQTQMMNYEYLRKAEERRIRMEEKEKLRERLQREALEERKRQSELKRQQKAARLEQNKTLLNSLIEKQAESFREKELAALERKKKYDAEREKTKGQVQARREKAEALREQARQRQIEHEQQLLEEANHRRELAQQQMEKFLEQQAERRRQQHEIEQAKANQRRQAFEQANQLQESRKDKIRSKREEQEAAIREANERRHHDIAVAKELEHFNMEDKQFLVSRQTRAMEFRKITSIAGIQKKKEKAEVLSTSRQKLLEATLRDRELMRQEKEAMEREVKERVLQVARQSAMSQLQHTSASPSPAPK